MKKMISVSAFALVMAAGVVMAEPQPGAPATTKPTEPAKTVTPAKVTPAPKEEKKKDAPAASLKVGDKAPAINVENWVKGEAVKGFEPGKVYVVEFWATWCSPCIASIPHLNKAQQDHPALTVIGVAASEHMGKPDKNGKSADNRLEGVKEFVAKQGKNMDYRVAFDGKRAMSKDWMQAAGQNGIPCAFIIGGDGKIAYIGHPSGMDAELSKALKATEDAKKTASK